MLGRFLQSGILYWIGLTDLADEGTYVWQTDYRETNFTFWEKPQPDNGKNNEDCVHLTTNNFQWNDRDCEQSEVTSLSGRVTKIHALCERNAQP